MSRWPAFRSAALTASLLFAADAFAQGTPPSPPLPPPRPDQTKKVEPVPDTPKGLDSLFERLAKAEDEEEAKGIANLIERRWLRSGSDVVDLLMSRGMSAMQQKDQDLPQAIELFDRVLQLEPQFAEAYNKRATAFFLLGDYQRSMLDVRETLAREPRHYGALAGLGQILLVNGDKKRAMEAFRKASQLNPRMPNVKAVIERLAPDVDGRDT
ncbi:MAG: tetratricopeptide repeat protein [Beijerinckiaceae bacterium]